MWCKQQNFCKQSQWYSNLWAAIYQNSDKNNAKKYVYLTLLRYSQLNVFVIKSFERILTLVVDLLSFSKIKCGWAMPRADDQITERILTYYSQL